MNNQSLDELINQSNMKNREFNQYKPHMKRQHRHSYFSNHQHHQQNNNYQQKHHQNQQYQQKHSYQQHYKKKVDRTGEHESILDRLKTRKECQETQHSVPQVKKVQKVGIKKRLQIKRRNSEDKETEQEDSYDQMLAVEKRLEDQRLQIQQERLKINKEFKTITIENMGSDIQVLEIKEVFAKFGSIQNINVQWNLGDNHLEYVKIQYDSMLEAQKAQQETDGAMLNGKQLQAKLVKHI